MDKRPWKIAMVVPRYGRVGGGERFVMSLTEHLVVLDELEIHVFANRWDTDSDGVYFHKVPIIPFPRFLRPISFAYHANRRIAATGMDLIHTHDRIFQADLFTSHGLPHATWIREVRRKHLSLFDRATAWLEARLITSPRCRSILAVSSLVKEKMIEAFPQSADKIRIVTPGVDLAPYQSLDRQECRTKIRRQMGISENDPLILFVGMNWEVKGLEAIMAAVGLLKNDAAFDATKLLVVGKGDAQRYQTIAEGYGIGDDTYFTGVWRDEVAPLYMAADLFTMLSVYDTFGLTVLEAMGAGLPVILSPTVGARDIVRNGENGYIVDREHPEHVCQCMRQALLPESGRPMANSALETAQAHSWSAMARIVASVYDEILLNKISEIKL